MHFVCLLSVQRPSKHAEAGDGSQNAFPDKAHRCIPSLDHTPDKKTYETGRIHYRPIHHLSSSWAPSKRTRLHPDQGQQHSCLPVLPPPPPDVPARHGAWVLNICLGWPCPVPQLCTQLRDSVFLTAASKPGASYAQTFDEFTPLKIVALK